MLRTIIISPDPGLSERLAERLAAFEADLQLSRIVDRYPDSLELARILRAHAPDLIFLSFASLPHATAMVRYLESHGAGLQIVAINNVCEASHLRESMRAGVREFLTDPFDPESLADALRNVNSLLQKKPAVYESTNHIFSFLPSKAGVGCTTLALNVSAAVARGKENSVLLTDFDLNSGMLRFLTKVTNEYSVVDAVEACGNLDEAVWPQLVSARFGMDVLHAGRVNPNVRVEPTQVQALIQFMRRNYESLFFDLSGNLERYSIEVMQESRRVFLVCTPEIPSLHLAREKMGFLKTLGLDNKTMVLLNRLPKKSPFTSAQVEELVGAKVAGSFSNDYFAVSRATTAGQTLDPQSVIGKQCSEFAATLGERRPPASAPDRKNKKFLEFFNVGSPQLVSQD